MNKKIKYLSFFILILIVISFLLFNEYGIVKYVQLKKEIDEINNLIEFTEAEISQLNAEIDSLKSNLSKIEKVARENYHILGKNEQALKVKENK